MSNASANTSRDEMGDPLIQYNLILVGDEGVGKSTFVKRVKSYLTGDESYLTGVFGKEDVAPLVFHTNRGVPIQFLVWNTPGQYDEANYSHGKKCAMIMFDVTSRGSYESVPRWHRDLTRVGDDVPIVLCGNKVDIKDREVKTNEITFHREKNHMKYFDISAKTYCRLESTFLWLARKLSGDDELYFVEKPYLLCDEWSIVDQTKALYESELKAAYESGLKAALQLQSEDDDDDL